MHPVMNMGIHFVIGLALLVLSIMGLAAVAAINQHFGSNPDNYRSFWSAWPDLLRHMRNRNRTWLYWVIFFAWLSCFVAGVIQLLCYENAFMRELIRIWKETGGGS